MSQTTSGFPNLNLQGGGDTHFKMNNTISSNLSNAGKNIIDGTQVLTVETKR